MITDLTSFANIEAPHVNGFEPTVHITDEGLESYNTIDVSGARWIKNLSIVTFDDAEDIGSPTNPYIVANYFAGQIQAISTKPDPTDPQYRLLIELVYDTFTVGTYDQPTDPQYAGQEVITHWIRHQYGDITEVEVMPFQLVEDTSYSGGLSNPNTRRIKIRGGVWEIPTQGAWNSGTPRMISGGAFTTGAGSDPYSFATVLSGCEIEDGQVQWWYLSIDTSSWYTLTAKMLDHYPTYESLDSNIKRLGYVQNIGGVLNFVQVWTGGYIRSSDMWPDAITQGINSTSQRSIDYFSHPYYGPQFFQVAGFDTGHPSVNLLDAETDLGDKTFLIRNSTYMQLEYADLSHFKAYDSYSSDSATTVDQSSAGFWGNPSGVLYQWLKNNFDHASLADILSGIDGDDHNGTRAGATSLNNFGYVALTGSFDRNNMSYGLGDSDGEESIDVDKRTMSQDGSQDSLDWANCWLACDGQIIVDWKNDYLYDSVSGNITVDWHTNLLKDFNGKQSVDWCARYLRGFDEHIAISWSDMYAHQDAVFVNDLLICTSDYDVDLVGNAASVTSEGGILAKKSINAITGYNRGFSIGASITGFSDLGIVTNTDNYIPMVIQLTDPITGKPQKVQLLGKVIP